MVAVAAVERLAPRRPLHHGIPTRWVGNLGLFLTSDALGAVILLPAAWVGSAYWAYDRSFGLLNVLPIPLPVQLVLSVLALDFVMWLQHWIQHKVPVLWRSHRVHHSDLDLDVTSSLRFHPFERIYTTVFGGFAVLLLGLPVPGVLLYELANRLANTLTHASLRLPERVDGVVSRLLVTPDFHRLHHSADETELDLNYGTVFSIWDRWLRTHQARPVKGHADMELGLPGYRDASGLHILRLLVFPFRGEARS